MQIMHPGSLLVAAVGAHVRTHAYVHTYAYKRDLRSQMNMYVLRRDGE